MLWAKRTSVRENCSKNSVLDIVTLTICLVILSELDLNEWRVEDSSDCRCWIRDLMSLWLAFPSREYNPVSLFISSDENSLLMPPFWVSLGIISASDTITKISVDPHYNNKTCSENVKIPSKSASGKPFLWTIQLRHDSGLTEFSEFSVPNCDPCWSGLIWEPLGWLLVGLNEGALLLFSRPVAIYKTEEIKNEIF